MVDMGEIIRTLLSGLAPFIGKAIVAIIIISALGFVIDLVAHKIRNRKKKNEE